MMGDPSRPVFSDSVERVEFKSTISKMVVFATVVIIIIIVP